MEDLRIGLGFDVHRFAKGRKLVIGGVELPFELGLDGHSDADVLTHAVCDALLGASRLGDIGKLFPDTDESFLGADSIGLLGQVCEKVFEAGYCIVDCDCVICAEKPKLSPYRDQMRERLSQAMSIGMDNVGIKATTSEGLGFEGRLEGVSAQAVCLLRRKASS